MALDSFSMYPYILLDVLGFEIWAALYFDETLGRVKIQSRSKTTSKNIQKKTSNKKFYFIDKSVLVANIPLVLVSKVHAKIHPVFEWIHSL